METCEETKYFRAHAYRNGFVQFHVSNPIQNFYWPIFKTPFIIARLPVLVRTVCSYTVLQPHTARNLSRHQTLHRSHGRRRVP